VLPAMDKRLITINSFPSSERKLKVLEEQISYFKKLGYPILLVSGCNIPDYIISQLDYFILNTENTGLDKHYTRYLMENGFSDASFSVLDLQSISANSYNPNVNNIITQNIKLIANVAQSLGFTSVFYTEDDNVFKDLSFSIIENTLDHMNNSNYKLATIIGEQVRSAFQMAFTTFFFFDVEFFNKIFTIPSKVEEWYDLENIKKYSLYKTYEAIFYDLLAPHFDKVLNIHDEFVELVNQKHIDWGVFNRYQNENFIIDNYFIIVPTWDNTKTLILYNFSWHLFEGSKEYKIKLYFDEVYINEIILSSPGVYNLFNVPENINQVVLEIEGYGKKTLDTSWEVIKNNGLLVPYSIYWSN